MQGPGLKMSSLVVAANVAPAEEAGHWPEYARIARPGTMISPLPARDFEVGQPLLLYFELYGLQKDEVNATSYRITYAITSLQEGKVLPIMELLGRLLGREEREGTVSLLTQRDGIYSDVQESVRMVFPGEVDSSRFEITVTVEDLVSGQRVRRSIELRRR